MNKNTQPIQQQAGPSAKSPLFSTIKAVAWAFLGVRRSKDFAQDQAQLKPHHLIAGGIVGVVIFLGILFTIVHGVVPKP